MVEKSLKPSKEAPASQTYIYIPPHYVTCNLCPGLHAITSYEFSHFTRFPLLLCCSHLGDGASEFIKLCENCDKSGPQRFVSLYDFSLPLCLSHLPDGASEFNKFCENCEKSFRLPTYSFSLTSSSLIRRADVKLIALTSH